MAKNYPTTAKAAEHLRHAREAEREGESETAIRLYEQSIKENTVDPTAYDRLMILYRKEKDYKNEERIIDRAIKIFQEHHDQALRKSISHHKNARKLLQLSNAILKKPGLEEANTYRTPVMERWLKRKEVVRKRRKKAKPAFQSN